MEDHGHGGRLSFTVTAEQDLQDEQSKRDVGCLVRMVLAPRDRQGLL